MRVIYSTALVAVCLVTICAPTSAEIVLQGTPESHEVHKERIYDTMAKTIADIGSGKFVEPLEVAFPDGSSSNGKKSLEYISLVKETISHCTNDLRYRGFAFDSVKKLNLMAAGYAYSCIGIDGVKSRKLFIVMNDSFEPVAILINDNSLFDAGD